MTLIDQLFSSITANPPSLNPGAGGWDAVLDKFMADQRGRHGLGLLSRLIDVTGIPTSSTGTILVTCPPGWRAMPLFVAVFAASNPGGTMDFTIDTGGANEMWAEDVSLTGVAGSQLPFLVLPKPEGLDPFGGTPRMIPIIDGDDNAKNTFRVNRDTAGDIVYSFFTYGIAWPSAD